ncbi:MAG TPA: hypothetical protein PLL00_06060 [Bacteroidia bacterium]|jgi:capsular polysaccharide biosynthesis protein|nr:hypothetical protein [Bacteroidia bacterium]
MYSKNQSPNDFNSLNVLYFIYKWRKVLGIVGISAIVISGIVSLLIQEKYKSTVILFPATTNSISKVLYNKNDDVLKFGEEGEAEQMLQILSSEEIKYRIAQKFNLMKHYGIDSTCDQKRTLLENEFQNNITLKRTELMSVKIDVLDKDPVMAADIANDIAALHDSVKIRIQKDRIGKALSIVEKEYKDKMNYVNSLSDSIRKFNSYGLYDYESQSEVMNEQYAIAISRGDSRAMKSLEDKLKVIGKYGSAYLAIRDQLELQQTQLNLLQTKYEETKVDAEQQLPQKFIVSRAFPAEKRAYPVRWIIVLVSTVSTLILAILVILLIENINEYRIKLPSKE